MYPRPVFLAHNNTGGKTKTGKNEAKQSLERQVKPSGARNFLARSPSMGEGGNWGADRGVL